MRWFLFILIFAFGNAWTTEPQHQQPNSRKQQAKNEQRGAEQSPVFINGEVTVKKDKQEAESDANERKLKAQVDADLTRYTKYLAEFTFFVFVFTAFLWIATYRLSRDARKVSDRQGLETANALAIATDSADAAKKAADVAERTLTDLERPYIFAFGAFSLNVDQSVAGGFIPFVTYSVANYGKTPGIVEGVFCEISKGGDETPEETLFVG